MAGQMQRALGDRRWHRRDGCDMCDSRGRGFSLPSQLKCIVVRQRVHKRSATGQQQRGPSKWLQPIDGGG